MTVRQSNQEESGEAVVTVPREPTPEMLARGFNCFMAMHDLAFAKSDPVAAIYRVMIAAAPKPATPITTPAIDEEGLAERLYQAADDIVSGATIFSDRVHGLLWEAAYTLERQALGDTPNG